jgi:hypothetical protein
MRIAPPLFVAGIGAGSFSSVVLALHGSPRPLWAFLVLGAALASCLVCRGKSREARSISRALRSLPAAQLDGTTLWGEHATAILTIRCQRYPTQIELEQLCRSRTGRWFSFYCYLPLGGGAPSSHRVEPRSPDFARGCLLTHEALYQRYFGLTSARPSRSHT